MGFCDQIRNDFFVLFHYDAGGNNTTLAGLVTVLGSVAGVGSGFAASLLDFFAASAGFFFSGLASFLVLASVLASGAAACLGSI